MGAFFLIFASYSYLANAAAAAPNIYLQKDAANKFYQISASNVIDVSCSIHAIRVTRQLKLLLDVNPLCSHQEIYDALNDKPIFEEDVKHLASFLKDNEAYYAQHPSYTNYLSGMNREYDFIAPYIKPTAIEFTNKWTKRPIASGVFFKDIYQRLFHLNLNNLVIYEDGINEDLNENLSIYYGSNDQSINESFLSHRQRICDIVRNIKLSGGCCIFNFSEEISEPFSHWIVVLIRNIGNNEVEEILIDAYGGKTSKDDQRYFPGWLYQNCIKSRNGDCPVCMEAFDNDAHKLIVLPCCNAVECSSCADSTFRTYNSKAHSQGCYDCPIGMGCVKYLPLAYESSYNPRLSALASLPIGGIIPPSDIGMCQINNSLGSADFLGELQKALASSDTSTAENWVRNYWLAGDGGPGSWSSFVTMLSLSKTRNILDAKFVDPMLRSLDSIRMIVSKITGNADVVTDSIMSRLQLIFQKGESLKSLHDWLDKRKHLTVDKLRDKITAKLAAKSSK